MELSNLNPIKTLLTQDDCVDQLRSLGFKLGDVVEVHASLKAIGFILGGPNTLIEAFLTVLGHEGTLVMPAQAWDNSEPAYFSKPPIAIELYPILRQHHPIFQSRLEDLSQMGRLALAMQKRSNVQISDHPQVAMMAIGKHAKWITQEHKLEAMFSEQSPLGRLRELKAKVCLLGVDYDVCTGMHLAEHLSKVRPIGIQGSRVNRDDQQQWVKFLAYHYDSDDFKVIGQLMEEAQLVHLGSFGQCISKIMDYENMTRFTQRYFEDLA